MRIVLFLIICTNLAWANNEPAPVPLKIQEIRSQDWYLEQRNAWEIHLKSNNTPEGWINYFIAAKYGQSDESVLSNIIEKARTALKEPYTADLLYSWQNISSPQVTDRLLEIEKNGFNSNLLWSLLIIRDELNFDEEKRKAHAQKLLNHQGLSISLLNYSYNVLMSVKSNGILITDGDNTTLPLYVLQDVFKVRTDVSILNLDFLLSSDYRSKKLLSLNLNPKTEGGTKASICLSIPLNNPDRNFFYALTIPQQLINELKDKLYVVGLASQISEKQIDNIQQIKENFEKNFLMDYLLVDFNGESGYATGKVLGTNYLFPALLVLESLTNEGDSEKIKTWTTLIDKIAEPLGKREFVERYISSKKVQTFISAGLNPEFIEGKFKLVKDKIYANETEVTNTEYNRFLNFLQKNNLVEIYNAAKIDLSKYEEPSLSLMKNYHADVTPTKKDKFFTQYPVVNITYEGAIAYCKWLTEQYNNTPGRKYKKVIFRLPSHQEWQMAALGYKNFQSWNIEENKIEISVPTNPKEDFCKNCPMKSFDFKSSDILYPWFFAYGIRNKPVNNKGCALGNFKWPDTQKPCMPKQSVPDGFVLMSPAQAYFPNGMGLYDVVGNVAEMISEKGKACGGSWNHFPEESTILSITDYQAPDASIGFRVFMEVIEP